MNGPSTWKPATIRFGQRIMRAQGRQPGEPRSHCVDGVGDDRDKTMSHAVGPQSLAGSVQARRRQVIGVEIDAAVAVDLKVHESVRRLCPACPAIVASIGNPLAPLIAGW